MHTFGELLRGFRRREDLSQETLADKLGVHRNSISDWERDEYLPRTRQMVLDLSEALGVNQTEADHLLRAAEYPLAYQTQERIAPYLPEFHSESWPEEDSAEIEKNIFVARKDELAQLKDFLAGVLKDQQGRVVFVNGEPGSGKATLSTARVSQLLRMCFCW